MTAHTHAQLSLPNACVSFDPQTHDLAVIFDEFDKPKAGSIFLLSRLLFHLLLLILGLLLFVLRFIAVAPKRVKLAHD
jgi:hypothetical protein